MAKIRRFYISNKIEKAKLLKIPKKLRNHLINVLRMKNNSTIRLFGPDGREFISTLIVKKKDIYALPVEEISKQEKNYVRIILCQALPKLNKMDFIVQKLTELGVQKIIPFISSRVVLKQNNIGSRILRWRRIAEVSASQCGRNDIPEIENQKNFEEIINADYGETLKLILTPESNLSLKDLIRTRFSTEGVVIIIGPEGGFEPSEIESAKESGFTPVKLWENILRTETAGLIVAGIVRYEWG